MDKLIPATEKPLEVDVGIKEQLPTDAETKKALQDLGLVEMTHQRLINLKKIGLFTRGTGTIHLQRGRAMFTQQVLENTLVKLYEEIEAISNNKHLKGRLNQLLRVSHEIGHIGSKITESQELVNDMEREVGTTGKDRGEVPTAKFTPGKDVQVQILADKVEVKG